MEGEFIQKFEEKLNLKHASSINLLNELKKAKSEKQARKIAHEHWKNFKKNFKIDLDAIKTHQFNYKFTKENLKVNIILSIKTIYICIYI